MQVSKMPEYAVWVEMKRRCLNPNHKSYEYYGGRGIKVCKRWRSSFQNFLDDVGKRPAPNLTLDRINNDSDYKPSNIRWATRKEQANNRRNNKYMRKYVFDLQQNKFYLEKKQK